MAYTSANNLGRLIMGELNNNAAFNAGRLDIANLTKRSKQNALGRLATTGMSRTGITQSVLGEINRAAGESYGKLAGQESARRSQIIDQLLGLYQFQKEQEAKEFGIGDFFGGIAGLLTGSLLGPIGAAGGSFLGDQLTGLLKGSGKSSDTTWGDYSTL